MAQSIRYKTIIKQTRFNTIVPYFKRIIQNYWDSKLEIGRGEKDLEPNRNETDYL